MKMYRNCQGNGKVAPLSDNPLMENILLISSQEPIVRKPDMAHSSQARYGSYKQILADIP